MEWREKGRWFPFGALLGLVAAAGGHAIEAPETGAILRDVLHDFLPFSLLILTPLAGSFMVSSTSRAGWPASTRSGPPGRSATASWPT
jgi:hypothetical protein